MGEAKRKALARQKETIALDTFGGRVHVEWDPDAAVTPLGQLPFFIEFLKVSGLFDAWVDDCPLSYQSNNASAKREVLATFLRFWQGIPATRTSPPSAMMASIPNCLELRNSSPKMRPGERSRRSTKPLALPGWTSTWAKPHAPCCPRRGYSTLMER